MTAMDRLTEERQFHDRQAWHRAATFQRQPDRLVLDDDNYLDHESWLRFALGQLGDVSGRRVLDCGCGHGMAAVVLARRGARVVACDLSAGYVAEARARASANGVAIDFLAADAERLPFAAGSFDRVWGHAILHHLDLESAGNEICRILRPGGVAVFCEPWGENPWLDLARHYLPYPGKHRTPDERPLRDRDVRFLGRFFCRVEVQGFQLFSMARRVLPGWLTGGLAGIDEHLLHRLPGLRRFCRYVVLTLSR